MPATAAPSDPRGHADGASVLPFRAAALRAAREAPSPLPRRVLHTLLALVVLALAWIALGRLDIVAVADGRLVPRTLLKVVQPAESGVVQEILVAEGDHVLAGQALLRLDALASEADVRALRGEVAQRQLAQRRIDAELLDRPLARHPDEADADFQRTEAQHRANRAAHLDLLAQESAAVARIGQELMGARQVEAKLERTLPIVRSAAERYATLQAEGFVSELAALERRRETIEKEQDLLAQRHAIASLQSALEQAERRLAQVASGYRQQLHAERMQNAALLLKAREALAKELHRHDRIDLRAPQAGVVKEVAVRNPGTVVGAGTVLVTLVPHGDELQADVSVRNDDAGFVRAGQRAQVKVAAYPFQKYGMLEGEVIRVAPDALDAPSREARIDATAVAAEQASGYRARIALSRQSMPFEGESLPFAPGMLTTAEIHLGQRTLADYLLGPVRRAWHDAARER